MFVSNSAMNTLEALRLISCSGETATSSTAVHSTRLAKRSTSGSKTLNWLLPVVKNKGSNGFQTTSHKMETKPGHALAKLKHAKQSLN